MISRILSVCPLFALIFFIFTNCDSDDSATKPEIISISPTHGILGSTVNITGKNFIGSAVVSFNGGASASGQIVSTSEIVVVVPMDASTGSIALEINGETVTGPMFTVDRIPKIISIDPSIGPVGKEVKIQGTSFNTNASGNVVKIGSKAATVISATENELVIKVPNDAVTGSVTVEANGFSHTNLSYTVVATTTIIDVSPKTFTLGCDLLTIKGTNFDSYPIVSINGVRGSVKSATATEIVVNVPVATSDGPVVLETNYQKIEGDQIHFIKNTAVTTMGGQEYSYEGYCTSLIDFRYYVNSAPQDGGFNNSKPSFRVYFKGPKPTVAGLYDAEVAAERSGSQWNYTLTKVDVSFDGSGMMVIQFRDVMLKGASGVLDTSYSGTLSIRSSI